MVSRQSNFTFCVTSFLRPKVTSECVRKIREFYPTAPILVGDQPPPAGAPSGRELNLAGIEATTLRLPMDCGASFARNRLIEAVETPYFVLLDDDMFISGQHVEKLASWSDQFDLDVVGGRLVDEHANLQRWDGNLWVEDECLRFEPVPICSPVTALDVVPMFFLGRTERLRGIKWCEAYKIGREHIDYFWILKQSGVRVGLGDSIVAEHLHARDPYYSSFRKRADSWRNDDLLLDRVGARRAASGFYHGFNWIRGER